MEIESIYEVLCEFILGNDEQKMRTLTWEVFSYKKASGTACAQ